MVAPMTQYPLPDDIASLKAMVIAQDQLIEALKLTIAKLRQEPNRMMLTSPGSMTPPGMFWAWLPQNPGQDRRSTRRDGL